MGGCPSSCSDGCKWGCLPYCECKLPCDDNCCTGSMNWCAAGEAAVTGVVTGNRRLQNNQTHQGGSGSLDARIRSELGLPQVRIGTLDPANVDLTRLGDLKVLNCGSTEYIYNQTNFASAGPMIRACVQMITLTLGASLLSGAHIPGIRMSHGALLYGSHPNRTDFPHHISSHELPQNMNVDTVTRSLFHCMGSPVDGEMACVHHDDGSGAFDFKLSNSSEGAPKILRSTYFSKDTPGASVCQYSKTAYHMNNCCQLAAPLEE